VARSEKCGLKNVTLGLHSLLLAVTDLGIELRIEKENSQFCILQVIFKGKMGPLFLGIK
jgi:hypothetical protein